MVALRTFVLCMVIIHVANAGFIRGARQSHRSSASAESNRVWKLPGLKDQELPVTTYAGLIAINESVAAETAAGSVFYLLFEAESNPEESPLVLWLQGGPGCSSEFGAFFENGPLLLNKDLTLSRNDYSWTKVANVLYVDQPVGTGYSFTERKVEYVSSEKQIADELYEFLQQFFILYPQYAKLPFFIFGESYAGHYVPAIGGRILYGNQDRAGVFINLKGIGIGNGMTHPALQFGSYAPYAHSHGLIDEETLQQVQVVYEGCVKALKSEPAEQAAKSCDPIPRMVLSAAGPVNMYDVRLTCPPGVPLCYDTAYADDYFKSAEVQQALHVIRPGEEVRHWSQCDGMVGHQLNTDWFVSQRYEMPMILDHYRVLLYVGDMDFICNLLGNEAWVQSMDWQYRAEFNSAPRRPWMVDGELAGYVKTYAGLSFVGVRNAGHMVPQDQPKHALELLTKFLNNEPITTEA
mmetsp:Transcript_2526/g.3863  ORF Transcript_2526/g.3863 Transcript_2526/m.3863 type:complete len:464 (+) Transcript_2526:157-1548(+)